jgi:outer membrane protein OmpA-like peptidoglycan-associated protein
MKIKTALLIFLGITITAFSQENKIKKANERYNNLAYIDAIEIYEQVAKKGFKSKELFQKLGNSYYFNGELKEANNWYSELFKLSTISNSENFVNPEYYYRYSQTLKSVGDVAKSDEYLRLFSLKSQNDHRAQLYVNNKNYLEKIKMNSGRYTIHPLNVNSSYSDYGSTFYNSQFIFASSRLNFKGCDRLNKWDNQAYTNLLVSTPDNNGNFGPAELFSKKLDFKFNVSTPVFTKDGKTVYFTRNNYNREKGNKNKVQSVFLKIYKATYKDGDWSSITELPFNSKTYNVAHPALSPDEKTLYFASNMPGAIGESDLYKVKIYEDGTYGKPENLGTTINTEGRETFPFVSESNELFFASDGQLGLGGLDIFAAQINADGSISKPENIGAPVNSSFDDFCYYINPKTKQGFFSSNRNTGLGFDDIYKFTENRPLIPDFNKSFDVYIVDKETNYPIPNAWISLFDEKMNLLTKIVSNDLGIYKFDNFEGGKTYLIRAEKENYETVEKRIFVNYGLEKKSYTVFIDQKLQKIRLGLDLAKLFNCHDIYFNLDQFTIRKDAEVELAKVAEVMKLKPYIMVDVRAHSDSRQTDAYNLRLSNLRAKSTINWLVKVGGIDPKRLSGRGYGESQILNKCTNGVPCTEEEHAINRRSEFIIVGFMKE